MEASRKTCYKATDRLGRCLGGSRYSVGEEYGLANSAVIKLCKSGLHFCKTVTEVFVFYPRIASTRVFEVEPLGKVVEHRRSRSPWTAGKCATDRLKIVRELPRDEILGNLAREASNPRFSLAFRYGAAETWRTLKDAYDEAGKLDVILVEAKEVKECPEKN